MEYKFERTVQGPVLVGDDEVLFLHQFGGLQDYIDADPEFFTKAFDFCQQAIREYGNAMADAVTQDVPGLEYALNIMSYWAAVDGLRRFKWDMDAKNNTGFPGVDNPNIPQF